MGIEKSLITVVIPVKDDPVNLRLCISRLAGIDQIVVVGSGANDSSRSVAEEKSINYIEFEWDGKFPKKRNWILRNYAFQTDWVLFLDADEYVSKAFFDELNDVLSRTSHVGFWLNYDNYFMGKRLHYGDPSPKLALFRIGAGEYEQINEDSWSHLDMEVHEHPVLVGSVGAIKTPIEHKDYRGLAHWIIKHNDYSDWEANRYLRLLDGGENAWKKLTPRQRTKYRHIVKWWFPFVYFCGVFFYKKGILDGVVGFRLSLMKSWYFYTVRLKILELLK
ncbi:glycosyltransferase family 2 protein [Rubellicoccus peritrichatus]|uniref:Glycosyltransferase family 2 protein n=1 Tax=Rubellicoccus peritrichatus TaxID=3080537 RepID=A0AAQ3QUZ5_9BACT|nr:glycosyltransferase family 2 protein [Puniceicoccus sp. CR14]WOO42931.1 glycosyltransferase family 2 protein [Puniceicoccus sp. CR14]